MMFLIKEMRKTDLCKMSKIFFRNNSSTKKLIEKQERNKKKKHSPNSIIKIMSNVGKGRK